MALLAEHETRATTIVEMARTQQFDAVFIDPLTPSQSPVELPDRIRMISPHTKVILMSTPCPPTIREQLRSQGVVSEFFVEPAVLKNFGRPSEFIRAIRKSVIHSQPSEMSHT